MAIGLKMPVGVTSAGGAALLDEPDELRKLVILAISEGEDDNPFQQLGIDMRIIFAQNDPSAVALARSSITAILNKFDERLALDSSVPIQFNIEENGELRVQFRYVNLDSNEPNDFNEVLG